IADRFNDLIFITMRTYLLKLTTLFILMLILISCQSAEQDVRGMEEITALPLHSLSLEDMAEFRTTGDNWIIAGNVQSDYNQDLSMDVFEGTGVLANVPDADNGDPVYTELEHGDIELKMEFLVPKGSNSGIYFQGRYEVQILDSWKIEDPDFSDVGGIYERWDETLPEGQQGFEGVSPRVNAGLAPGLWQEYHILFRAPKFDDEGNKTENARFEWINLNGTRVHENAEVTGPTRGAAFDNEQTEGPLMIQGDHGPVAFRNISYKKFGQTDSLTLGEMDYTVYDYNGDRTPGDFEELEVLEEGTTHSFNVSELSPKNEHYAITFSGDLEVPVSGDYFFQTMMDDGGNLYVDDELVVENTGEFDAQQLGNIIYLEEGSHRLDVSHFQIMWGASVNIFYEGPEMEKRPLVFEGRDSENRSAPGIFVNVEPETDYPEIIGGFVNFGGVKRTHTVSVGYPEGVHYSYDLNRGQMLTFWRNPFADVTRMWQGRGHEQLLVPLNASVEESSGIPVADAGTGTAFENQSTDDGQGVTEYNLDEQGRPAFVSTVNGITITDKIVPSDSGSELIRTLRYSAEETSNRNKVARLAQGEAVELLPNGLYRVNGRYYLRVLNSDGQEPEIHENDGVQALFIPVLRDGSQSEIQYELIW
ncbi:MAG: family 16 glycoside hydrolase, partial [Balneolaceae bacterium]